MNPLSLLHLRRFILAALFLCSLCQCTAPQAIADRRPPGIQALRYAMSRKCAIVVSAQKDLGPWFRNGFSNDKIPKDGQLGTAAPISADGYLLTADHVIHKHENRYIHALLPMGGELRAAFARVVWRASSADLALLHVPMMTPNFYQFASPDLAIAEGSSIFHGGLSTGLKPLYGTLSDTISRQNYFTTAQRFRMDIPLVPGDSGGPILDSQARLIGVNSSVGFLVPMETPIFTESNGIRPNVRHLMKIIERDRRR